MDYKKNWYQKELLKVDEASSDLGARAAELAIQRAGILKKN